MNEPDVVALPEAFAAPHEIDHRTPEPPRSLVGIAAEVALSLPHLGVMLARMLADPRVPLRRKVALGASFAYWVSPLDLIPDRLPLVGQVDDVIVVAVAIQRLLEAVPQEVRRAYWPGSEDALDLVEAIVAWFAEMVPFPDTRSLGA